MTASSESANGARFGETKIWFRKKAKKAQNEQTSLTS